MIATMKHAKTIPNGGLAGIKTGVHKNTKMYITVSTMVCKMPNRKICRENGLKWNIKGIHNSQPLPSCH